MGPDAPTPVCSTLGLTPQYAGEERPPDLEELQVWDLRRRYALMAPCSGTRRQSLAFQDGDRRLVSITAGGAAADLGLDLRGALLNERPSWRSAPTSSAPPCWPTSAPAADSSPPAAAGRAAQCKSGTWRAAASRWARRRRVPGLRQRISAPTTRRLAMPRPTPSSPSVRRGDLPEARAGISHEVQGLGRTPARDAAITHRPSRARVFNLAFGPDGRWLARGARTARWKCSTGRAGNAAGASAPSIKGAVTGLAFESRDENIQ